jgi:hypothetical protein
MTNPNDLLYAVLSSREPRATIGPEGVHLPAGFTLRARWTHAADGMRRLDVHVHHPMAWPAGLSIPITHYTESADAERELMELWSSCALSALHEAVGTRTGGTMHRLFDRPDGSVARVILGPVWRQACDDEPAGAEHGPLCPCCAFRHTIVAMPDLGRPGPRVVQTFVLRVDDGRIAASVMLDGELSVAMTEALVRWVRTWPPGFDDIRHQLSVILD